MMMATRWGMPACLLCAAAGFWSGTGRADPPVTTAEAPGIEEIIVTAQKRTENLREVPQSISVLSGTQIEEQHIDDYADLARVVPDLSFTNSGGPGLSNLEIRGISSTVGTSTVSIYLDDAPITIRNNSFYSGQPEPLLFDLGQTEVLRGPQGTLYGSSAMGGTIRLVSNPVDLDGWEETLHSELSGTEHGGVNYVERGVVNIPIVADQLGLRLGLETVGDSGFVDHANVDGVINQTGINDDQSYVAKAALLFKATPKLTITTASFDQRTKLGDTGLVDLATPDYTIAKLVPEGGTDSLSVSSVKVNYDFDWADLTSVSSYTWRRFLRETDGTFFNSEFLGTSLNGGAPPTPATPGLNGQLDGNVISGLPGPVYNTLNTREAAEELRLVSKPYDPTGTLPITWIAGLYFADSQNLGTSQQFITNFNQVFISTYGAEEPILGTTIPADNQFFAFTNHLDDREYASFGEISYYPLPQVKLTGGLRYLYGRVSETDIFTGFFSSAPIDNGNAKSYAATPKFSLTWDVDPDVTAYATAGKGFRLGGINASVPALQCAVDLSAFGLTAAPPTYAPDKLWNYELGAKARFLDNTLSVNTSVYDIEWNQIQIDVPLKTCGFDFVDNVGSAESYGMETEIVQKLGPGLQLGASGVYNNDTFTQSVPGLGVAKGDVVPGSPKWSANFTLQYQRDLSDGAIGFVRTNWQFIGDSHGTFVRTNPDYQRPTYDLLGASIGADFDAYEVSLFAKNLLDADKIIQRPEDNFAPEGYTPTPLIIGVAVDARF
jgi:iron complex outermembrane receptor protein